MDIRPPLPTGGHHQYYQQLYSTLWFRFRPFLDLLRLFCSTHCARVVVICCRTPFCLRTLPQPLPFMSRIFCVQAAAVSNLRARDHIANHSFLVSFTLCVSVVVFTLELISILIFALHWSFCCTQHTFRAFEITSRLNKKINIIHCQSFAVRTCSIVCSLWHKIRFWSPN